ncbi:hypothetical protein AB6A40_004723 [Gnathostoma spinigerum]|uniref:Inositol polyphosphate-related phosphatase domain-containing protein n=1 Tax=Gnathostoma spinigerum TaxID=75299 RepID=A0ABD6EDB9_9BILA
MCGGSRTKEVLVPKNDQNDLQCTPKPTAGNGSKYCTYSETSVFVSTFNVNGKAAPTAIPEWFVHPGKPADFYVIGLQEMDLSTQAFFYDVSSRQDDWINCIARSLPSRLNYSLVEVVRLVGIMLVIFRRSDCKVNVPPESVHSVRLPTGIQLISRMGNKGGVAVSMQMNDSLICFVNSHMAAGTDELDKRNQDYRELSQIRFEEINKGLFDHDVLFWFGDLNYRLETQSTLTNEDVRELCACEKTFRNMIKFDTLKQQQRDKHIFSDFMEPDILNFRPSYKYDPGTSRWDSSEKCRCPAWCDRILWWSETSGMVVQLFYDSVDTVVLSDHKPVRSLFKVTVRLTDKRKVRKIQEEAIREADRRANEALPQVWLSQNEIDFGDVYFFESSVKTITIKNVGKSKVVFSFIARPNRGISDSWLSVTPPSAHLKVGMTCPLSLQVLVDKKTAWKTNKDGCLSDILVLRLDHGRDYFIPVTAKYHQSVFGSSFHETVEEKRRKLEPTLNLIDLNPDEKLLWDETDSQRRLVPTAMERLIESLRRHGLSKIRFDDVAKHSEFLALRNALDTGRPADLFIACKSPFNMFNAYLRLMDSFRDIIIPLSMQTECLAVCENPVKCWECVEKFPAVNKAVFEYYIEFARDLINENPDGRSQLQVMADIAFKSEFTKSDDSERLRRLHFLESLVAYSKDTCLGAVQSDVSKDSLIKF